MESEIEKWARLIEELELKIQKGKEVIEKARAEGKDVSEWEKSVAYVETQVKQILEMIFRAAARHKRKLN